MSLTLLFSPAHAAELEQAEKCELHGEIVSFTAIIDDEDFDDAVNYKRQWPDARPAAHAGTREELLPVLN